jgi:ABC-2 type transport system permease protein
VSAYPALVAAGFRRWSTYRAATAAGALTNSVFGAIKASVLMGTVSASGASVAGYDPLQAATYAWVTQALLAPVSIWADTEVAQRVRTGDIAVDLARPIDPQLAAWASDLGRAAYMFLPRGVPPLALGALVTGLSLPTDPLAYLLGILAVVGAVSVSFAARWIVNLTAFWLTEIRGVLLLYSVSATVLTGLAFPVTWFPDTLRGIAYATPFPSMLQTPVAILTGSLTGTAALQAFAAQVLWLLVLLVVGRFLLFLGARRLVVQGG